MRPGTAAVHRALVADAVDTIQRDLHGDIGIDLLAERVGVSPFHFHRVFREIVGEPPAAYVRRLRLERAALRLKYSRLSVTEIAFEAGYETHEAFTRAFKARFGEAPRCFRAERSRQPLAIDVEPAIVRIPTRWIASVRHVGPYDATHGAFAKVMAWAERHGVLHGATFLAVFWDDQTITPPERTRCEVGLYVGDDAEGDDEVEVKPLPGGDHAVLRFDGPAHDRRRVYDLLYGGWLRERGHQPADAPPYEEYFDDFDLSARVHVPLAPKQYA